MTSQKPFAKETKATHTFALFFSYEERLSSFRFGSFRLSLLRGKIRDQLKSQSEDAVQNSLKLRHRRGIFRVQY